MSPMQEERGVKAAWRFLERIGLFVMLPFTWLAELLLEIREVDRLAASMLDRLERAQERLDNLRKDAIE